MKQTPTRFWLTNAKYLEEKRAVFLEFSRLNIRRMSRQSLFPSFYASRKELALKPLKEALSSEGKRFRIEEEGPAFKISASTFSGLQHLANALFNETGFRPLVLEPERQLLLERNWSFFDCFTMASGNPEKSSSLSLPEARLDLFSEPLHETVCQLAQANPKLAEKTLESIALSQILSLPLPRIPESRFLQQERLLESLLWKSGASHANSSGKPGPRNRPRVFVQDGFLELDFTNLWPALMTKPVFNLGHETLNCECCRPKHSGEENVLPSSLVLTEMKRDAFYFESSLPSFAEKFHESTPGRKNRERRKEEFCLKTFPLGPFFRGQLVELPLFDALKLQSQGSAFIVKDTGLSWFCRNKESLLSSKILSLGKSVLLLEAALKEMGISAMKQHRVIGAGLLEESPDFLFKRAKLKQLSGLISSIPGQLCSPQSAFFSRQLAYAIESIEAGVLESFETFAASRDSRLVRCEGNKALLRSEKPYSLIKQFSERERVPALIRASAGPNQKAFKA